MAGTYKHFRVMALLAGLLFPASSLAADLHFVYLADTNETDIGVTDDFDNAYPWAQKIAQYSGLTLNYLPLSGNDLTIAKANTLLNNLTVDADDVIYFGYSGHGYNPDNGTWPTFWFATPNEDYSFNTARQILSAKGARLLIMLGDCCNNYPGQSANAGQWVPTPESSLTAANFRRLFVDFSGTLLASGCEPGQYSLGFQGAGGLFTYTFQNTLEYLAATESILDWESVMSETRQAVDSEASYYGESQTPQYEIVAGVMPETPDDDAVDDSDDPVDDDDSYVEDDWDDEWDDEVLGDLPTGQCGAIGPAMLMLTAVGSLMRRRRD